MADTEINLTDKAEFEHERVPLSQQIKLALLADAHAQRSHREADSYLSAERVFPVIREMIESLIDLPEKLYERMSERLNSISAAQDVKETVLGSNLQEVLAKDCFFSGLSAEIRAQVEKSVEIRTFAKGECICEKGQLANTVFVVLKGNVEQGGLIVPEGHALCLNAVLEAPGTYQYDIKALDECQVGLLTKEQCVSIIYENQLAELSGNDQKFFKYMKTNYPQLADEEIELIGQIGYFVSFNKGEFIAKREEVLTSFYVVLSVFDKQKVELECLKANSNHIALLEIEKEDIKPNYVREGQIIGVSGVILGKDEKRDCYCEGVVECFRIDEDELKKRSELFGKLVRILNE